MEGEGTKKKDKYDQEKGQIRLKEKAKYIQEKDKYKISQDDTPGAE